MGSDVLRSELHVPFQKHSFRMKQRALSAECASKPGACLLNTYYVWSTLLTP